MLYIRSTLSSKLSSSSKKTRPRKESSKYQAILQAARELVEENGYRSLSIKAISTRAGVSRNVLYNWWDGDISRIVEEAILPNVSEWSVPNTGSLETDLAMFIDMSIEAMHRPNVLGGYLELASHVVNKPEDLERTSKQFRAPYARLLGKILQKAQSRGELDQYNSDDRLHYSVLAQIISGCVLQFAISKKPGKRKTRAVLLNSVLRLLQ
ncbi:hypothetical protein NBRC116583_08870 [Arenicella sp. 4NH20-0111]|uniref:TetR/AcrR family transcriptional regulator n=1 Tax=Arenicella sp. 4NH20-0111 TaxID=3127648 RepID=UPI0031024FBA